jgi:hypothetical protein
MNLFSVRVEMFRAGKKRQLGPKYDDTIRLL